MSQWSKSCLAAKVRELLTHSRGGGSSDLFEIVLVLRRCVPAHAIGFDSFHVGLNVVEDRLGEDRVVLLRVNAGQTNVDSLFVELHLLLGRFEGSVEFFDLSILLLENCSFEIR